MERKSGVLMHVSSLPSGYSIGGFGKSAYEFIDFLHESGFTFWQVLPFCVTDEFNSPYKSWSSFSINPYFIDLETLFDEGLLTRGELDKAGEQSPYLCEFSRLSEERLKLLKKAAARFDGRGYEEFFSAHPHTDAFVRFMALRESNENKPWQEWEKDKEDENALKLWRFTQFKAFEQWKKVKAYANSKNINIIGDIPIYVSLDSSDVWETPHIFQLDERYRPTRVAGVPPDYFCEDGQLWGNPLYDFKEMKKDSYSWWKDRVKFACELFDGVRIDHFRAFESYYSIPAEDVNAKRGKWCKGPGISLIKEIKKVSGNALIIAEDLGVITDKVEKLVKDSSFPGMRVLQFGFLEEGDSPHLPHNYENNTVAYTGTHDNNTLLGFVWEMSEGDRNKLLRYVGHPEDSFDTCYDTVMRVMLQSHAGLVVFPIQDLLKFGSDTRLNTPGSCDRNWAFRVTGEQMRSIDRQKFRYWNELYGRR